MLPRLSRPHPATVISLMALFVALGGTSVAAVTLSKNSVLSKHIKNGQVRRADIASNAINSAKVANGSLLAADFRLGQLPKGPAGPAGPAGSVGPAGPAGPAGAAGATNVLMRQGASFSVNKNGFATGTASCQPGERATGGGVYNETNVFFPRVVSSYPTPNPTTPPATGDGQTPTGWRVWMALNDEGGLTAPASVTGLHAYVICAQP